MMRVGDWGSGTRPRKGERNWFARGGIGLRLLSLVVLVAMTACAAPARGPADTESSSGSARPAGPKRVVAATIGDPFTVYQKLNIGNSVRGINEIERMVHA